MKGYIDMHIHSTNSDGILTPIQILQEAEQTNTETISITDHDKLSTRQKLKDLSYKSDKVKIIPGAELSTDYYIDDRKVRVHLLCYGIINSNSELVKELRRMRLAREEGNRAYIKMLLNKLPFLQENDFDGFEYSKYGRLKKLILSYISLEKYTVDEQQILIKCLEEIKPIYQKCTLEIADAIELVKKEKGYTSFAHPYQTRLNELELRQAVKRFKEIGIDAIETFHANATLEDNTLARKIARDNDLLESCGSDIHTHGENENIKNIGLGLNGNMCITETSLAQEIIENKKFFLKGIYQEDIEI